MEDMTLSRPFIGNSQHTSCEELLVSHFFSHPLRNQNHVTVDVFLDKRMSLKAFKENKYFRQTTLFLQML